MNASRIPSRDRVEAGRLPPHRDTLVRLVRRQAQAHGDREFLRTKEGRTLGYRELDERSTAIAHRLASIGVGEGDRVTAVLENSLEHLLVLLAANKRNAIFVPLNPELRGAFLDHQIRNSDPKVLLVDFRTAPSFATLSEMPSDLARVLVVGEDATSTATGFDGRPVETFAEFEARPAAEAEICDPAPGDVSTVIYTSGTTGPSKGVMMPHAHCVLFGTNLARVLCLGEDDVFYVCMPLFHANALFMQTIGALVAGARVVLVRRFSASSWLSDLRAFGATVTNGLGVMPEFIFRQPATRHDADHRLRAMMAVPIAAEWGEAFERRFGVKLVQGFGLSESNMVSYSSIGDPVEPGCAGRVLEHDYEVKIVDPESEEEVPRGRAGEIVIRPKHPSIFMSGYFRMPDRTVEAWRNLWFHTGDSGCIDEQGRLFFVDRIKDCIRRRGENISSYEVEQVLNSHPGIAESAVIAAPSGIPGGEDEVKACIVLRDAAVSAEEIIAYCRPRMPRHAVPRFVEFVDGLPKTPTGKIQKQLLRQEARNERVWDREAAGIELSR